MVENFLKSYFRKCLNYFKTKHTEILGVIIFRNLSRINDIRSFEFFFGLVLISLRFVQFLLELLDLSRVKRDQVIAFFVVDRKTLVRTF